MEEGKTESAMHLRALSSAKGVCSAGSECTQASSETSVLLDLTTKSAKGLMLDCQRL